jgi:hypothetical protein
MGKLNRVSLINDKGDRISGTFLNDQEWQKLQDVMEQETLSGNWPNVSMRSLADNIAGVGAVAQFGGASFIGVPDTAYPVGATPLTAGGSYLLAPNTSILRFDTANVLEGTYGLEAMLATEYNLVPGAVAPGGAATATLGLFNLTDASEVPMVEISLASYTGGIVTSAAIVWPLPGTLRNFGVKLKGDTGGPWIYKAWGIQLVRIG